MSQTMSLKWGGTCMMIMISELRQPQPATTQQLPRTPPGNNTHQQGQHADHCMDSPCCLSGHLQHVVCAQLEEGPPGMGTDMEMFRGTTRYCKHVCVYIYIYILELNTWPSRLYCVCMCMWIYIYTYTYEVDIVRTYSVSVIKKYIEASASARTHAALPLPCT